MDVPSWHPANQDAGALRRLAMSSKGSSQRTEFKEIGTSTEEERQMVAKEETTGLGGGRGLLDPSDRLYLVEQTLLEQQTKYREQLERRNALQTFRSNASKIQALKQTIPEIPVVAGKKSLLPPEKKLVVVVKAKKRKKKRDTTHSKLKRICEVDTRTAIENQKKQSDVSRPASKSAAIALLVEDYASDDGQK